MAAPLNPLTGAQHRCVRHLFVDALDGVAVRVSANEDNRGLAHRAKPSGDLNPFAASFEIESIRTISG